MGGGGGWVGGLGCQVTSQNCNWVTCSKMNQSEHSIFTIHSDDITVAED